MNHHLATILLSFAAPLAAQNLAGEFTPSVAPIGTPVTFTITDSTGQGLNLPSMCTWYAIFQGSQTGPRLTLPGFCLTVLVPVAPGGSASYTWDQRDNGSQVPAGNYWFRASVWDSTISRQFIDWFCLTLVDPGDPTFTMQAPAQLGQTVPFAIQAPQQPSAIHYVAMSFSSNNPVTLPGLATSLSLPIFTGMQNGLGALDAQGNSTGIALSIPNLPALHNRGLHAQALLLSNSSLLVTNDVSITLR